MKRTCAAIVGLAALLGCGERAMPEQPDPNEEQNNHTVCKQGPVLFEWFGDFQGPFDGEFYHETFPIILADYGSKIDVGYKHFPLTGIHPQAEQAAEAAECARDQGRFWEYVHTLYNNQQNLGVDFLKGYAHKLEMDTARFETCVDQREKKSIIKQDTQEALDREIEGVPTFFIDEREVIGAHPYNVFRAAIEEALQEHCKK